MENHRPQNFALIGGAGYIAPRHFKAIKETQNDLKAFTDPHDSVGAIDSFFPQALFFTEFERFDRFVEKLSRASEKERIHYISICSPNHLHDAHIRFALRSGAHAICEKPLVLNPWNIDALQAVEDDFPGFVNVIHQLRLHENVATLKNEFDESHQYEIKLDYITSRGPWYHRSWKGNDEKSGGVVTNIGVHLFDMLIWIYGAVENFEVENADDSRSRGILKLKNATVRWNLSIDAADLPPHCIKNNQRTYRSITVDGKELDLSQGFNDLHTLSYANILKGQGFGLADALPAIQLCHNIRHHHKTKE